MNYENNGQNTTNFMSKIKKQAKKLFQLSKINPSNLQVKSLSQAQEILAQINGYSDWHALTTYITSKKIILEKNENEPRINLERYEYGNLHYHETKESIMTFLRVNALPREIEKLQTIIENFNNMLSFLLNMGIHEMSIIFEQKNKKYNRENSYSLYEVSKGFNLSQEDAKKLFYIDKSNSKPFDENSLTIFIIITTPIQHKREHINICLNMLENYKNFAIESIPYFEKEQLEKFQLKNGIVNKELKNSLFKNSVEIKSIKENNKIIINKWVYLLNYLYDKKIGFLLKYSLVDEELTYEFEDYDNNKDLIDRIIVSIMKTNIFVEQELNYLNKPNFNYVITEDKNGLSLKSQINNRIFNYNDSSDIRTSHIDLIVASPGYGKSILTNMIALSSILGKDLNLFPQISIIDVGSSYQGMIRMIKNILPVEMKHMAKQYNIENSSDYAINLLDLPLGKRVYDHEDVNRILEIILSLFDKVVGLSGYLKLCLSFLNELNDKYYRVNENLHIDKTLDNLSFINSEKTTWWNVVDFLFTEGLPDIALKAQRYATPIISDIVPFLIKEEILNIYGEIKTETGENLPQYVNRVLTTFIDKNPHLNKCTSFEINETKIVYFNLDKVCSYKEIQLQNYWFSLILNLTSHKLMGVNSLTKNYPSSWNQNWKTYLKNSSLNFIYEYYNYKNFEEGLGRSKKIIIDEFHRFSNNSHNVDQVTVLARESRKNNIAISISTQSLTGMENLIDYSTAFFTTGTNNIELLKYAGFENNEIELTKKTKFLSWAIKIKTNRGKIFDIVKLELSLHLQFALSNTMEDMTIQNELMKKNTYFEMLDKSINYLKKNNITNFKVYFEKEIQNQKKYEDIVKYLTNEININY